MAALSRDALLAGPPGRRTHEVEMPEWGAGATVTVAEPSALDMAKLSRRLGKWSDLSPEEQAEHMLVIAERCLVDPDGRRLFGDGELKGAPWPWPVLTRIFTTFAALIERADEASAEGNDGASETTIAAASRAA